MPVAPEISNLPECQLRQACAELDRTLRAGGRCRAEQFFAAFPLLGCQEDLAVELIYTEFVVREELGHRPTPEEYYARFGHLRDRLQRQLQVHELLRETLIEEEPAVPAVAAAAETLPPAKKRTLGQYELQEEIARGGSGVVYRAWQLGLDRLVAVKVLRPEYCRRLRFRQQFCQEARVQAALRHRHIMPIHDIGESQGLIYFSMDFAPGSLVQLLPRPGAGPRPPEPAAVRAAVGLLEKAARAVHHAHRLGVIHCDLKPSNILLDEEGEPLLSDFGLARRSTGAAGAAAGGGAFAGTPTYMAPEQVSDGPAAELTPATDVWALGVILYEMLTGCRPFHGGSLSELREQICAAAPLPPRHRVAAVDAALEAVCLKCLVRDPAGRHASAERLADELRRYTQAR
jgi:serine/threonine protein kinase